MFSVLACRLFTKHFQLSVRDVHRILSFLRDPDQLLRPVLNELKNLSFERRTIRIERRNVYTLRKGMFYEASYITLLQEDEHDLVVRISEQECRCKECVCSLRNMRLWFDSL